MDRNANFIRTNNYKQFMLIYFIGLFFQCSCAYSDLVFVCKFLIYWSTSVWLFRFLWNLTRICLLFVDRMKRKKIIFFVFWLWYVGVLSFSSGQWIELCVCCENAMLADFQFVVSFFVVSIEFCNVNRGLAFAQE